MFAYLSGTLAEKTPVQAVVDCGGVGYLVEIPLTVYEKLPPVGEKTRLQIYYHVSDDGVRLFGFLRNEEKSLFKRLLGVNRIGPKLALAVLSTFTAEDFTAAVLGQNIALLARVPGLGRKSAERLVVELRDSLGSLEPLAGQPLAFTVEAEAALINLGYKQTEVQKVLSELGKNAPESMEELIKEAIRMLYRKTTK